MNKKLIYLFAIIVIGLFVISACQQEVGRRVNLNDERDLVRYGENDRRGGGNEYELRIAVNPQNGGEVTKNPNKPRYNRNEEVRLEANPQRGYEFRGWFDDTNNNNRIGHFPELTIIMNSDKSIIARFFDVERQEPYRVVRKENTVFLRMRTEQSYDGLTLLGTWAPGDYYEEDLRETAGCRIDYGLYGPWGIKNGETIDVSGGGEYEYSDWIGVVYSGNEECVLFLIK